MRAIQKKPLASNASKGPSPHCPTAVAVVTQCQRCPARSSRFKRLGMLDGDRKGSLILEDELRTTTSGSPLSTAVVVDARLVVVAKCVASNDVVSLFHP